MLAEANVPPRRACSSLRRGRRPPADDAELPGEPADLCYALATGDLEPLQVALHRPDAHVRTTRSGCMFLRRTTSCDLGQPHRGTTRSSVFAAFAPEIAHAALRRGIRRRMAPMLGNDRRRIELAFSLLFSLPGTPMMQYGDEIGIGRRPVAAGARLARGPRMQWSSQRHGRILQVRAGGGADHRRRTSMATAACNVADQRRDPSSLLNWCERQHQRRGRSCRKSAGADHTRFSRPTRRRCSALALCVRNTALVTLHNFADRPATVQFDGVGTDDGGVLCDFTDEDHSRAGESGKHRITVGPAIHKWYRVGGPDTVLKRAY